MTTGAVGSREASRAADAMTGSVEGADSMLSRWLLRSAISGAFAIVLYLVSAGVVARFWNRGVARSVGLCPTPAPRRSGADEADRTENVQSPLDSGGPLGA